MLVSSVIPLDRDMVLVVACLDQDSHHQPLLASFAIMSAGQEFADLWPAAVTGLRARSHF